MGTGEEGADAASVALAYFEAIAERDSEAMAALWEPGGVEVIHGIAELRAPEEVGVRLDSFFAAFPDFSFELLDVIADGEKVAVHWRGIGTFDGDSHFEGLKPNGAGVDLQGCDVLTIRDGRIRHKDAYMNGVEMARQLGVLPEDGSSQEKAMTAVLNLKTRLTSRIR